MKTSRHPGLGVPTEIGPVADLNPIRSRRRAGSPVRPKPTVCVVYQSLASRGLEPTEAGNLTAYLAGIHPVEQGWTIAEIGHLLFVRHLVEQRRLLS
jgi:hypothetical protein